MEHAALAALVYALPLGLVGHFRTLAEPVVDPPVHLDPAFGCAARLLTRSDVGLIVGQHHTVTCANTWIANHLGYAIEEMAGQHAQVFVAGAFTPVRASYVRTRVPMRHKSGLIIPMDVTVLPLVTPCSDRLIVFRRLEDV